MEGRGIMSPQRSQFSPKLIKRGTPDRKPAKKVAKKKVVNNGSKQKVSPIPKAVSLPSSILKPPEATTSPNHNKNKPTSAPSSPAPTPSPSPNTNLGKATVSKSGSLDRQKHVQKTDDGVGNQNHRFSPAASDSATLHLPDFSDRFLQRLSFDGKDLADILQENSLYDLISSNKKEESSSQSNDRSRIFQIYKEIASHRQENLSVETYFKKLEELWVDLACHTADLVQFSNDGATDNPMGPTEREKVMQFLMGLNDSYTTICSQILFMSPFPTVEKAYYEISREEKRRELVIALETMAAKVIQTNWLLTNQKGRSNNNGDNNNGSDQEVDNSNLRSPK